MGRPRKNPEAVAVPKKAAAKKAAPAKAKTKKRDNETLATLAEIESKLLKKAKNNGNSIDQSDIYDALNMYELEDDVIDDLIEYFAKQKIEVVSDDEDEEEEEDEEEFDESKMSLDDDDDDFFESEDSEDNEETLSLRRYCK